MEQSISVRSDRIIWDNLWKWSTLSASTGRAEMPLSIWQNCCPYRSSVSCLQVRNWNELRPGLGLCNHSIEHMEFPKSQTEIFVEWKVPRDNTAILKPHQ